MYFVIIKNSAYEVTSPAQTKAAQVLMRLSEVEKIAVFHTQMSLEQIQAMKINTNYLRRGGYEPDIVRAPFVLLLD